MIHKPTRREFCKYAGLSASAAGFLEGRRNARGQTFPFPGNPPAAASSPVLSHTFASSTNGNVTTPAISTTGATMLLAGIVFFGTGVAVANFSDSQSNTWVPLIPNNLGPGGTQSGASLFWVNSPTTNASHTLSWTAGSGSFESIFFIALKTATITYRATWNGGTTYAQWDVVVDNIDGLNYVSKVGSNTGNQPNSSATQWVRHDVGTGTTGVTSEQGGAVVPFANGSLVITIAAVSGASATYSIDSGFTIIDTAPAGASWTGGLTAYLVQGTAGSINPTVSKTGATANISVGNVFFKP